MKKKQEHIVLVSQQLKLRMRQKQHLYALNNILKKFLSAFYAAIIIIRFQTACTFSECNILGQYWFKTTKHMHLNKNKVKLT